VLKGQASREVWGHAPLENLILRSSEMPILHFRGDFGKSQHTKNITGFQRLFPFLSFSASVIENMRGAMTPCPSLATALTVL